LLAMAFSGLTASAQRTDTVYLYNGQVLIGEVQSGSLGTLYIDDIDMKIVKVKYYKIRRMNISETFKITTIGKQTYYGVLMAAQKPGWGIVQDEAGFVMPLALVDILDLVPLNKEFFKRLVGNLSAGFSYTKSSNIGQLNLSANVGFATKKWEFQLQTSEIGSIDSGKFSRDNESIQLFGAYTLSNNWFLAGALQYQRNLELSIARRYLELMGAGNKLVIRDTWQLYAITGLSVTQEKSTEGVASPTALEIPLMFRFNFYKFQHPDIQISTSWTGYFSLTEKGRFRYDGNTSFSWQLIRYFYLTINPYSSFDTKPPSGTGAEFDFGIAMSLTYKF
ncbi:MAG TPA: DUF481 domain-containing protein, partial [Puia sp.]|nr:DUF481 domain-containing protein [Puia sp.]